MSPGSPEACGGDLPAGEDELWEAVADPSRRKVLDLILARGQATPTTLAAELAVTRQAVAKHLAVLARAGLVEAHRHGREVRYTIQPGRLDQAARAVAHAAQAMTAAAARWDRRLHAIKRLAEALASSPPGLPAVSPTGPLGEEVRPAAAWTGGCVIRARAERERVAFTRPVTPHWSMCGWESPGRRPGAPHA